MGYRSPYRTNAGNDHYRRAIHGATTELLRQLTNLLASAQSAPN